MRLDRTITFPWIGKIAAPCRSVSAPRGVDAAPRWAHLSPHDAAAVQPVVQPAFVAICIKSPGVLRPAPVDPATCRV